MFSGPCRVCFVSNTRQLVAYAALGLGWDRANNLASSRLEFWTLGVRGTNAILSL